MNALYRKPFALPSLALSLLFSACDNKPPARQAITPLSNSHLEALQDAEATRHGLEQRILEQKQIDELLDGGQAPAR